MNKVDISATINTGKPARNAILISAFLAVFLTIATISFSLRNTLEDLIFIGSLIVIIIAATAAAWSSYKGHVQSSMLALIGIILFQIIINNQFSSVDDGLLNGFLALMVTFGIAVPTLSGKWLSRVLIIGSVVGLLIVFIDLFQPTERTVYTPFDYTLIAIFTSILIFFLIRQLRISMLRPKLIASFVFIALIGAIAAYVSHQSTTERFTEDTLPSQQAYGEIIWKSRDVQAEALEFVSNGEEETIEELNASIDELTVLSSQIVDLADDPDEVSAFATLTENANEMSRLAQALTQSHGQTLEALETMESIEKTMEGLVEQARSVIDEKISQNISSGNIEELEDNVIHSQTLLTQVSSGAQVLFFEVLEFVVTGESNTISEFEEAAEQMKAALNGLEAVLEEDEADETKLNAQLDERSEEIKTAGRAVIDLHTQTLTLLEQFEDAEIELNGSLIAVEQLIRRNVNESVVATNKLIIISAIVTLTISLGLGFYLSGLITQPISRLAEAAQQLDSGNLSTQIQVKTNDEIGILAVAFNSMTTRLQQTLASLQARSHDLELSVDVGRDISQVRDLTDMLADTVELIRERFNLYYAQIYLTDPSGRTLILRAGTGQVGQKLVQAGHRLLIDFDSLNGTAAINKQSVFVEDTNQSKTFRAHPLLPHTRSEMVVPLIIADKVLGVLDLQSEHVGRFAPEQVAGFVPLAAQLAIAIQNATLFAEAKRAQDEVKAQSRQLTAVGWQEFFNAVDRDERLVTAYDVSADVPLSEPPTLPELATSTSESHHLAVPITVAGATVGTIRLEGVVGREWAGNEIEVTQVIADKIGRQVENLRLVNEGKRSQFKAEQATRRLTREGWESYLNVVELSGDGYIYNQNRVQSLSNGEPIDAVNINQSLAVRGEEFGELVLGGVGELNEKKKALVQAVAEKVSDRMETLRLSQQSELALAQTEDQARRLTSLNEMGNKLGTVTNQDKAFMIVTQFMSSIISHDRLSLGLLTPDGEGIEIYALDGEVGAIPTGTILSITGTAVGTAVTQRQFINIPNLHQSDYLESKQLAAQGLHTTLVAPLLTARDGIGTLNLARKTTNGFDAQDENLIQQIAPLLASTIESQRLFQQEQRRASELETVAQVGTAAATLFQSQDLLQEVVDLTQTRFELYHAHVYLLNNSKDTLILTAGSGEIGRKMVAEKRNIPLASQESLVAAVARSGRGAIRNYEAAGEGFMPHPLLANTQSELAVAIALGDEVLGVLDVKSDVFNYFGEANMQTLTTLASQVAVALQNARSFEQSQKTLRELDTLTRRLTREGWEGYLDTVTPTTNFVYGSVSETSSMGSNDSAESEALFTLDLPLTVQNETIGQITMSASQILTDDTVDIVGAVTERLSMHIENLRLTEQTEAAALENLRLFNEAKRRAEQEALINTISQKIQTAPTVQIAMQTAVSELGQALKLKKATVSLTAGKKDNGHT